MRRSWGALLVLALLGLLVGCGGGVIPETRTEAERLALARRLMDGRHYAQAIDVLKSYISVNAGSTEVDQAIYLLGECYLKTKDWTMASAEFERLLRDYPESDSSGSAAFMLGEATFGQARPPDFDQEHTLKALELWQNHLRDYPGHWRNGEARMKIAMTRQRLATKALNNGRLYLKLKLPGPARVYFTRIEQDYADTGLLADALIGLAECDAKEGKRAEAIAKLTRVEAEFAGQPAASRARRERAHLER